MNIQSHHRNKQLIPEQYSGEYNLVLVHRVYCYYKWSELGRLNTTFKNLC
jgi:hypothetical protein